jgi:hypothetical protein
MDILFLQIRLYSKTRYLSVKQATRCEENFYDYNHTDYIFPDRTHLHPGVLAQEHG